jgi:hypothetical protein
MKATELRDVIADQVKNADPKINREVLLEEIFKNTVIDFFKFALMNQKKIGRLPYDLLLMCKKEVINEFRSSELGEYQKSFEWYEKIFDRTLYDFLQFAGDNHPGEQKKMRSTEELEYAGTSFDKSGSGLYIPKT